MNEIFSLPCKRLERQNPSKVFLIEEFDPADLDEILWESYFTESEKRFRENLPEDPLPSRQKKKDYMLADHPLSMIHWWRVLDEEQRFIGLGGSWYESPQSPTYEENQHIIYFDIYINSDFRRKGIGTAYLGALVNQAQAEDKTFIRAERSTKRTGVPFCRKLGGVVVSERHVNRLRLSDIDWTQMDTWRKDGYQRAGGVTIERFEDVPEKDLGSFCQLYTETTSQAPSGDLAGEFTITPELRRQVEKETRQNGYNWTTLITRESSGKISGLTEISYDPREPHLIIQELTGVQEKYRDRGLGKLLKAEMAFFIKETYPDAQFIDTGNSDHNEPMLSINNRMWFKPLLSETFFEFSVEDLNRKLLES